MQYLYLVEYMYLYLEKKNVTGVMFETVYGR